jgi:hypothetical protein
MGSYDISINLQKHNGEGSQIGKETAMRRTPEIAYEFSSL